MTLSLKPDHLKRYRDIGLLLLRYVDSDLIKTASLDEALLLETESDLPADSEKAKRFAADLEKMGPSFIKLGQLLSTRPDLLPEHYVRALSRLQDDVEPFELAAVNATIESELGPRISKAFSDFDDEPIAAASLAQVHRATLRDGRPVAVKVQRPGIRQQILTDFNALQEVVDILARRTDIGRRFAVDELLKELRSALLRELDFRLEGQNLRRLKENLASYHTIVLPDPIDDYTTSRVLTMEFIEGSPVMSVGPLQMLEIDGERLAADLVRAYLDQILSHGFFHADPHPGNVLVTPDGRIGLLDLGMVAHLGPNDREQLLKLLLAITEGRGRDAASQAIQMGRRLADFNEQHFSDAVNQLVIRHLDDEIRDLKVGRLVLEVLRIEGESGLQPPHSLALLGKTLLNLDEISRKLAPEMQPRKIIQHHTGYLLQKQMTGALSPRRALTSILDAQDLARQLPARINTITDKLVTDRFTFRIQAVDEPHILKNLHGMVNRLSIAIVLAALIIGAAMMMQVETDFELLGYPALATILFLAAVACGFALVVSIFLGERKSKPASNRHPPEP